MKFLNVFIIVSLIIMIKNTDYCDERVKAIGPKDCKDLIRASIEDFCCYFEGKKKSDETIVYKSCIDLTPIRKESPDDYIKEANENTLFEIKIDKIECKSYNIAMNIIYFLLIFLL